MGSTSNIDVATIVCIGALQCLVNDFKVLFFVGGETESSRKSSQRERRQRGEWFVHLEHPIVSDEVMCSCRLCENEITRLCVFKLGSEVTGYDKLL